MTPAREQQFFDEVERRVISKLAEAPGTSREEAEESAICELVYEIEGDVEGEKEDEIVQLT